MAESSSFKQGTGTGGTSEKPEASNGKDTYKGGYKDPATTLSEAEKWGTNEIPLKNDELPAKNLKSTGG